MDISLRLAFEFLPVIMAMPAGFMCIRAAHYRRRAKDRAFFWLAATASVLLMLAQSSWAWTVAIGWDQGTLLANLTWTVFNALCMAAFIVAAWFRDPDSHRDGNAP